MICLIVTANDSVYERLARRARSDGDVPRRATGALDGLEQAVAERPKGILLDMELHAADTLLESLHRRPETAGIPLLAVTTSRHLPYALRRLCAGVLNLRDLAGGRG
jgi:DNA-binding response OmpR family regulator